MIERFSEDVDLSFDRKELGYDGARDPAKAQTGRRALLDELHQRSAQAVQHELLPALARDFAHVLGPAGRVWRLEVAPDDPQTILFAYPQGLVTDGRVFPAYIRQVVRLELGARADVWPHDMCALSPYAAEQFPQAFSVATCTVPTLAVERTFWEKATLLHAEAHRTDPQQKAERMSRHYYDLYMLAQSARCPAAMARHDLLASVVAHKQVFFRSRWARYKTAIPGTLQLVPPRARAEVLRKDYLEMQSMFFSTPPSWQTIMDGLSALEQSINSSAGMFR